MEEDKNTQNMVQKMYSTSCDLVSETAEYLASFSFGQAVLKQTDRILWMVEKCAEWSVPNPSPNKHYNQNGTFGKPTQLIRPLPWIIFLPMLIFLRVLRFSLNIMALLLGFESIKAISMVRFIQVRRRRIRALKFLGLRRIRQHKLAKEHSSKNTMTLRERFYNIMSRAMCFRVTNTDMYEEITIKKDEQPETSNTNNSAGSRRQSGRDLKRKYIEILKNNYYDWEDVEDDEELIDRITQLAEDDLEDEDPDFGPMEDSATEEDSISDAEEDAATVVTSPPPQTTPKKVQRLSSHGSIANEIIEEENEESESSTVSANSDDESSQSIEKKQTPKKSDQDPIKDEKNNLEPGTTSDEFFSPMNSISASPEPKTDPDLSKSNNESQNNILNTTDEKNDSINTQNSVKKQNFHLLTNRVTNHGSQGKVDTNSFSPKLKKHKRRRRLQNILRRKRK